MTKIARAFWLAVLSVSALTAQTNGSWEKVDSSLMGQAVANAHGRANVSFFPAIISIRNKPFTATRTYSDQSMENGENVGDPITAEWTIARDDKGRVHYEMAFESMEKGKLVIGGFDIQIYDPVAHTLTRYFAKADHSLPSEPTAAENRFVAVMGSSGCGKSSLVRAGLLPELRSGMTGPRSLTRCYAMCTLRSFWMQNGNLTS